jgi:transcriptional regulator with XRE-family HTH domain
MAGFNDNLKRAREAAGLSAEDLAGRIGAAPVWLAHLEAIGASLPELSHLVKLADALNCSVDDLLAGRDDEFDHPRRRHAALIATRLGAVSLLLGTLNRARSRGELSPADEKRVQEFVLLDCVRRCRQWVTSPDADVPIAASLERELDSHITRITGLCERLGERPAPAHVAAPAAGPAAATPRATSAATTIAPRASAAPPPAAIRVPAGAGRAVPLADVLSAAEPPPIHGAGPSPGASTAPPRAARPPGHQTKLWSRPATEDTNYVCEMYTGANGIEVRLVCGDRVLASKGCRNLDEAFGQSSAWKRLPDPEVLVGQSPSDAVGAA